MISVWLAELIQIWLWKNSSVDFKLTKIRMLVMDGVLDSVYIIADLLLFDFSLIHFIFIQRFLLNVLNIFLSSVVQPH